eukprot:4197452-Amphidinium_carterae.2
MLVRSCARLGRLVISVGSAVEMCAASMDATLSDKGLIRNKALTNLTEQHHLLNMRNMRATEGKGSTNVKCNNALWNNVRKHLPLQYWLLAAIPPHCPNFDF